MDIISFMPYYWAFINESTFELISRRTAEVLAPLMWKISEFVLYTRQNLKSTRA